MFNGSPFNSSPFLWPDYSAAPEPVVIVIAPGEIAPEPTAGEIYVNAGRSHTWSLRVIVGGTDMSRWLTGEVEVDREEGAAAIGAFTLFIESGNPVTPPDWKGKSVTIDYLSTSTGVSTESRRLTGVVTRATWDPMTRLLRCECTDMLQNRVENLSIAEIDKLTGGHWSEDIFSPVDGRSRWDYALERMSTRAASLDCSPAGVLRTTSWYAGGPHFVFSAGTTLYQSVELAQSDLDRTVNRVEIEFSYRYSRLWQLNEGYSWTHSNADGTMGGFCSWRLWSTELPTTEMIESAISSSGQQIVGRVGGFKLPLSMPNPCLDGNPWINTFDNLWLSASVTGARRWTQTVTEGYTLTLSTEAGDIAESSVVQRSAYSVAVERDQANSWTQDPITGGDTGSQDLTDEARRYAAIITALSIGHTQIVESHRSTTLSWQLPSSLALTVDLIHTLKLEDQGVRGMGKCQRVVDRFDLQSGEAITTLTIAVMRGGGIDAQLVVPAQPDTSLPPFGSSGMQLMMATQLGGRQVDPITGIAIPPYDEDRMGFSGNYSVNDNEPAEHYPRRFAVESREIAAEYRDERSASSTVNFPVGIPNDLLEL